VQLHQKNINIIFIFNGIDKNVLTKTRQNDRIKNGVEPEELPSSKAPEKRYERLTAFI